MLNATGQGSVALIGIISTFAYPKRRRRRRWGNESGGDVFCLGTWNKSPYPVNFIRLQQLILS